MKLRLAAFLVAAAVLGSGASFAQQATGGLSRPTVEAIEAIMTKEYPPESLALAKQLVKVSGTGRTFDEVLPNLADQAKNAFIRANPQMQLGIIDVVDRAARSLVSRRPELDDGLARVWASGFTDEEMQDLIDFYSSETGKKFAALQPQILGVQLGAADRWARLVSTELQQIVSEELRTTMAAEQKALQGDIAGPAPQEQPAQ